MSNNNIIGILEIGCIHIKCLIFDLSNEDDLKLLSKSIIKSEGFHNGVVVNLSKATNVIRSCIGIAEKKAEISLKQINVVVEQPEFLCTKLSKNRKINGSKIHKEDIEFLLTDAKNQVTLNDKRQSIIHIFNHNYIVDGKTFIEEPIDVYADYLSHEMTFITMPKNNIKNIKQIFIECDIEVERFISCTFASAAHLLSDQDLQNGSILIDIGIEKVSLGVFKNLALVHSITLPIGINHITKDISKVCSLSFDESEVIRDKVDYTFKNEQEAFDADGYLKSSYFTNSSFRKISRSLILKVIKARLEEIFETLQRQIVLTEFKPSLGVNFFITGIGSSLKNLDRDFSIYFKSEVKKIIKANKNDQDYSPEEDFTNCLGAIKIIKDGWETEAIPRSEDKHPYKMGFFAKIFGRNT